MSTLRIHGIEAKSDPTSASVNEKIKITNSNGDLLLHLDGTQTGIGTVGITTTGTTFHVDRATGEITFVTDAKFNGTVGIAGTLTYEDVTNVDSLGMVTARTAVNVKNDTGVGVTINKTGITTVGGARGVNFNDNVNIKLGTDGDLELFHDGNNSYIKEVGTGALLIRGSEIQLQSVSGEQMIGGFTDGGVTIRHDNTIRIETTQYGAVVSGVLTATSFSGDGSSLSNLPAGAPVGGASTNTVFFENDKEVAVNYQITSTKNAMSAGPISINAGIAVTVPSGCSWTIV